MTAAPVEELGRSARKHAAILAAARAEFLANGFAGAGMDDIARRAEVSKQTVYKHFADKESLFAEVMLATVEPMHTALRESTVRHDSGDLGKDLVGLGTVLLQQVLRPDVVRLRHVICAEAERFPDVARLWHEQGPHRTVDELAQRLVSSGEFDLAHPRLAAEQLMWGLIGDPLMRSMFVPVAPPTPAAARKRARVVVASFLRAHRTADDRA